MNWIGCRILKIMPIAYRLDKSTYTVFRQSRYLSIYDCNFSVQRLKKLKIQTILRISSKLSGSRSMSTDSDDDEKRRKPKFLMNFEPVLRPEVLLSIKNWILVKFIIQPYLDNDFTLKDFTGGCKQALSTVSSYLSQGDFRSLKGLVSDDAIKEIRKNYVLLNVKERQDLYIKFADILFAFPYQIGIIFDDENQRRFAEITVVYHCIDNFEELKSQGKVLAENAKEDITICNYRFIREYTKGVESDWTINRLCHYKLNHFDE